MSKARLLAFAGKVGPAALVALAVVLRSNLNYRTAFVDEAINMFGGWQVLNGLRTYAMTFHMGWYLLSFLPLGLAGWLRGLEYARAVNAVWGVLTVWVVFLTARRAYGKSAGCIAGGVFAVFAPAIVISTFATYDSLSMLLTAVAIYCWVRGLSDGGDSLFLLGGLAMTAAVLAKYAAVVVAAVCLAYGLLLAVVQSRVSIRKDAARDVSIQLPGRCLKRLVLSGLPFMLLLIYAFAYRTELGQLWQGQVLTKESGDPNVRWAILKLLSEYLWLPVLLALPTLLWREKRAVSFGFWLVGSGVLMYHLLNKDQTTLYKHTCYMLVGLAPLAGGGLTVLGRWVQGRVRRVDAAMVTAVAGVVAIAYMGAVGQSMLPGLRSYWSDTSEVMQYMRSRVNDGDTLLMEGGAVGEYYLIARGTPGHIPARVLDTWWYVDEQGSGIEAYRRAIVEGRFDWIVFDYVFTGGLDRELAQTMQGRYELQASFPARVYGQYGTIDIFKALK